MRTKIQFVQIISNPNHDVELMFWKAVARDFTKSANGLTNFYIYESKMLHTLFPKFGVMIIPSAQLLLFFISIS